jgi:hypothetical protein
MVFSGSTVIISNETAGILASDTLAFDGNVIEVLGTGSLGSQYMTITNGPAIQVGQYVYDATNPSYIPVGTTVTSIASNLAYLSKDLVGSPNGDTIYFGSTTNEDAYYYQVIYQWTDSQGNIINSAPSVPVGVSTTGNGNTGSITLQIPTLRLSYKSNVKILIYRWSVGNDLL